MGGPLGKNPGRPKPGLTIMGGAKGCAMGILAGMKRPSGYICR
jgi:hypothetical protein